MRRTGTYFHSEPRSLCPCSVREPHTTLPYTGSVRRQLIASGLSWPFSASLIVIARPVAPLSDASLPAGAFHTPRVASVRANTPATKPHGGKSASAPCCNGSGARTHGKKIAEFGASEPVSCGDAPAFSDATVAVGSASAIRNARRSRQRVCSAPSVAASVSPGTHTRLKRSMRSVIEPTPNTAASAVWKFAVLGVSTVPSAPPPRFAVPSAGVLLLATLTVMKPDRSLITLSAKRGSLASIDRFWKLSTTALPLFLS